MELSGSFANSFLSEETFNELLDSFLSQLRARWNKESELKRVQKIFQIMKNSKDPYTRCLPTYKLMKRLILYHPQILERDQSFFRDNATKIKILKKVNLAAKMADTTVPKEVRDGIWEIMTQLLQIGCHAIINALDGRGSVLKYEPKWKQQCQSILSKMDRLEMEPEPEPEPEPDSAAPGGGAAQLQQAADDAMKTLLSGNADPENLHAHQQRLMSLLPPDMATMATDMATKCQQKLMEMQEERGGDDSARDISFSEVMSVMQEQLGREMPNMIKGGLGGLVGFQRND